MKHLLHLLFHARIWQLLVTGKVETGDDEEDGFQWVQVPRIVLATSIFFSCAIIMGTTCILEYYVYLYNVILLAFVVRCRHLTPDPKP